MHNQFDEARRASKTSWCMYPKAEVAKYATNLIIETYLVDKNWAKVEEVSARLAANKDVIDPKSELYKDLVKFKLAGRFKLADELMSKGDYEQAAQKYIQLVDEEPKHEFADKALNNAAVCYENVQRFDSALRIYERIFSEYPNSKLADAALFRVAVNAEKSYDFDKAIEKYQKLVKDYPSLERPRELRSSTPPACSKGCSATTKPPPRTCATPTCTRRAKTRRRTSSAPRSSTRSRATGTRRSARSPSSSRSSRNKTAQAELVIDAKKRIGDAFEKQKNEGERARPTEPPPTSSIAAG